MSSASPPQDGLPNPQRILAFLALAFAIGMAVLDGAIVNVALPTLAKELAVSPASAVWVANAYQLAVTVALLPLASLGDSLGYRRVYIGGLILFTLSSLACALSPSLPFLIGARIAQGLGGAGLMSVNIAIVRFLYPKAMLGRGVGNMAVIVASCAAGGPSVGAAILSVASWHWLFLVNLPVGAVALILAIRFVPRTPQTKHPLDALSVVLNGAMLASLVTGVDRLSDPAGLATALAALALAALLGALLVRRELGVAQPILPVDLLRTPVFALSLIGSIAAFGAQTLAFIALPFALQGALHRSQTMAGLLLTPWPLATALIAPISGRLADRFAPGKLGSVGLIVMALGLALTALAPSDPSDVDLAWRLGICGLGFGFFQSPNNRLIMGSAPHGRSGGAAGLQSLGRLTGQSLGAAAVAVIFGRTNAPTEIALGLAAALALLGAVTSGLR